MNFDPQIRFLISVPDWRPQEASPFQGFAPSLCRNSGFVRFASHFPSSVLELAPDSVPSRLARRIAGQLPIEWYGQSPRAIKALPVPRELPFTVVILDESESAEDYQAWLDTCPAPVTLVAVDGGHIRREELSFDRLRDRLAAVCDELAQDPSIEGAKEAAEEIAAWTTLGERELPYKVGGHGTIFPNVAALHACGFGSLVDGPFTKHGREEAHIKQIVDTSNSILDEREANPPSEANRMFPRMPDLNIYLPSTYDLRSAFKLRTDLDRQQRKDISLTLTMIERQNSYGFDITTDSQLRAMLGRTTEELKAGAQPTSHPIMYLRSMELHLGTEAISALAASEISAVVRPPNRMNRTRGVVRGFAQHYRADRAQLLKRAELFAGVQTAIRAGMPDEFLSLLKRSKDGIRVVSDAHIEWLDVEGIPLGLRYNVSRIPVTPGNLFIETLTSKQALLVSPDAFQNVLVISGLDELDRIAKQFKNAFGQFGELWRDKINLRFVRVKSRAEMVEAINAFDGMLMIFDGHGSHKPDEPGVLWLGEEAINIWDLRGEITRPPPIVLLSACDTHAADRNHATVANGFLSLGSRSVIGSVFPLHASHAAVFAARLLFRVSDFIPAAIEMFKRSISWTEIVSGMLRRQAMTDILRHLRSKNLLPDALPDDFDTKMHAIVDLGDDPFVEVEQALVALGINKDQLRREVQSCLASSSTISYLHLGRPETIFVNTVENLKDFFADDPTTSE